MLLGLIIVFAVGTLLELLLYAPVVKKVQTAIALIASLLVAITGIGMVTLQPQVFTVLFALICVYRLFNIARLVYGRTSSKYLQHVTLTTGVVLVLLQGGILFAALAWELWGSTGHVAWAVVAEMQFVVAAGLLLALVRNLRRTRWPGKGAHYSDSELPSLTVAVPARNETEDLRQCLHSIVATDYPKLEVLVYDDCSQTKKTPEIIKSFAQSGVRFLRGSALPTDWLAKNFAYDKLAREASGQYILFCGVDMRFEPSSFRQLIGLMLQRDKAMLSVVPRRAAHTYGTFSLVQIMRYWWELVPPRRYFNLPPVLSSCWVIKQSELKAAGGFAAVKRAITPEAHFARQAVHANDSYSFLRAGEAQGVTSVKTIAQQRDTAVRVRYPQLHRRPEQVAIHSLLEAGFLLLPFVLTVAGFWVSIGVPAHVLAIVSSIFLIIGSVLVAATTKVSKWWFALVSPPLMILTDIALLHYSMYKYEFSKVYWKGRNVCLPAMRVTPRLPKI